MAAYRFNNAVLDTAARSLVVDGEQVPLQRKVFDLLVYLITHGDRAVSKDELQDAVWSGVIVTEASLTRAIMKARRAVGDDADSQHTIRTVHGHGYQFVATLNPTGADAAAGRRRIWPALGAIFLIALVLVGLLFGFGRGRDSDVRIAVLPVELADGLPELSWIPLGLMSYVTRAIADSTRVGVIPAQTLLSSDIESADRNAPDFAERVMDMLDATHLVQAALRRRGNTYSLDYRVLRPGFVSASRSVDGADPIALADQMAREIISGLPGTGIDAGFRTVSTDPFVNEAYARGMSFQLQGDVAGARGFFELAAREDPAAFWPRYELALVQRDSGELEAAAGTLRKLLESDAPALHAAQRVAVHNALGILHWRGDEFGPARNHLKAALELTDEPDKRITILTNLGILARAQDDLATARNYLGQALSVYQEIGEPPSANLYQTLANVEYDAGNLARAEEIHLRALAAAQRDGDRRSEASVINALAAIDRRLGRWEAAGDRARRAFDIRRELGDRFGMLSSLVLLARLAYESGDPTTALQRADELEALAADTEAAERFVRNVAATRIRALVGRGQLDTAQAVWGEHRDALNPAMASMLAAELALASGEPAEARRIAEELTADPELTPEARIDAKLMLARAASEPGLQVRHAQGALELARAGRYDAAAARSLLLLLKYDREAGFEERNLARRAELLERFSEWPEVAELKVDTTASPAE